MDNDRLVVDWPAIEESLSLISRTIIDLGDRLIIDETRERVIVA